MKHSLKLAGSAAAGLAAAALICAPLAAATPEEDVYLQTLKDEGVTWPGATPENMIAAGQGVCTDWASGATFEQEVTSLAPNLDLDSATVLVAAATGAFCPEFESKFN
jgi:hypothetical protein